VEIHLNKLMIPYGLIDMSFSLSLVLMDKIPAGYLLLEFEPMRVSPLIVEEITTPKTHVFSYMGT